MAEDNSYSITLTTSFYNNGKKLHGQKCEFPIRKSCLDVTLCPTIKDVLASDVHHDIQISVPDINVTVLPKETDILPKTLVNAIDVCKACKYKCRERGAD